VRAHPQHRNGPATTFLAPGFEEWQIAPENASDVCVLESGSVEIDAGAKAAPFGFVSLGFSARGPIKGQFWTNADTDLKVFNFFQPMLYVGRTLSGETLVMGGNLTLLNLTSGSTVFTYTPLIPATVIGTIRFPENRWTTAKAGFKIKGGGLQFDETGVFLMPGAQYLKDTQEPKPAPTEGLPPTD